MERTAKAIVPIVRNELWQNQRGIPIIGLTSRYQSRKTRGGAALSAINNACDPVNSDPVNSDPVNKAA
ncbi:hypothetical protein [Microcoleus sp. B5-D4]|uniref:hypothetical protein n=1 Tax=Microcoleus sp. B5-D4 TaxID=2818681 RepID=UPI002FD009CF